MMHSVEKNGIRFCYKGEEVLVEACGTECIRVRASFCMPVDREKNYNLDITKQSGQKFEIEYTEKGAILKNGRLSVSVEGNGRLTFYDNEKKIIEEEWIDEEIGMPPYQRAREYKGISSERFRIQTFFKSNANEHIYGMGQEITGCFDLKGCTVDLCQKNTKCTIPFYVSSLGYGFLWNNPSIGRAEFAKNRFLWQADMTRQLDYVVIGGGTPRRILENYTRLTGHIPQYPDWIFGLWQSKLRYKSEEEVLKIADEYVKRGVQLSTLVIDYFHWSYQGDWRFDKNCFPNPKEMVEKLREYNIHLLVSVWPTVDPRSENYKELEENGLLIRSESGPNVLFMCRGAETYIDMTNESAAKFLYDKLKENYIKYGITSFWLDEAEPEIYPYDYENMRFSIGNGQDVSNYYPYAYGAGVERNLREDQVWSREGNGENDGINLIRSGWIGSQKLRAIIWSGDVPSTFESMKKQLVAGLQMAMCGIALWTTDIGGFYGGDPSDERFRELMIRWFQFGVFCPILRMHGYRKPYVEEGNMDDMSGICNSGAPNEIWSFGEEAYQIMKKYLEIRERLIPYIKDQLEITRKMGVPLMRPLVFDYPEDNNVIDMSDEYMFGDRILVAPIMKYGQRDRVVYLPGNEKWMHEYNKMIYHGGAFVSVEAPLDDIPVFIKV